MAPANRISGGFTEAIGWLTWIAAVAVTFLFLPKAYERSFPEVVRTIGTWYGPEAATWTPTIWTCVLALLIYSLVRAALSLVFSVLGLMLALLLLAFRRKG